MVTGIYINLPVKNLVATMQFFRTIGFTFNDQFTDDTAAALVLGKDLFVMLLTEEKFKSFVTKSIADTTNSIESITALQVENRIEVDEKMKKVIEAGGKEVREAYDYGFMYGRSFEDLDGHMWELFFMNPDEMPKAVK